MFCLSDLGSRLGREISSSVFFFSISLNSGRGHRSLWYVPTSCLPTCFTSSGLQTLSLGSAQCSTSVNLRLHLDHDCIDVVGISRGKQHGNLSVTWPASQLILPKAQSPPYIYYPLLLAEVLPVVFFYCRMVYFLFPQCHFRSVICMFDIPVERGSLAMQNMSLV
jgi:hypothetical protein